MQASKDGVMWCKSAVFFVTIVFSAVKCWHVEPLEKLQVQSGATLQKDEEKKGREPTWPLDMQDQKKAQVLYRTKQTNMWMEFDVCARVL